MFPNGAVEIYSIIVDSSDVFNVGRYDRIYYTQSFHNVVFLIWLYFFSLYFLIDDEDEVMKRLVDVQKAQKQSEELSSKNATLQSELTEMSEQLDSWRTEMEQLKENLKQAEKDKLDAEQKLTVLTEYFKDKELKLQRDVVMHETLRLKKEGDALSVSEQLDLYREQNVNLQWVWE